MTWIASAISAGASLEIAAGRPRLLGRRVVAAVVRAGRVRIGVLPFAAVLPDARALPFAAVLPDARALRFGFTATAVATVPGALSVGAASIALVDPVSAAFGATVDFTAIFGAAAAAFGFALVAVDVTRVGVSD